MQLIKKCCLTNFSHVSLSLPHCLNVDLSNLSLIPSSFLPFMFVMLPFTPHVWCQHSLSAPRSSTSSSPWCIPLVFSSPFLPLHQTSQSVIVKSVERNAVNMYEARKFLLGLESNGVSSSSPPVVLNPAPNGPSPSLICPVGLDILASAGLGLSSLGNDTAKSFYSFPQWGEERFVRKERCTRRGFNILATSVRGTRHLIS